MNLRNMAPGRPLRFLYLVLCLWFSGRATILLMEQDAPDGTFRRSAPRKESIAAATASPTTLKAIRPSLAPTAWRKTAGAVVAARLAAVHPVERPLLIAAGYGAVERAGEIIERSPGFPPDIPRADKPKTGGVFDRWSLSAWMLYRPDNRASGLVSGGQLGASQVGARLAYDLSPHSPYSLAIHGRVTSALERPFGAEGAMGLTWRPARSIPFALSLERRFALAEGGRNAFAAYAAGGLGPVPMAEGIELEGYAQAGVVGAARTDAFADGRIGVMGKVLDNGQGTALMAGVALSGGAQPSLSRLDFGPQLSARFPLGGGYARAALEWRERISGSARPASGPALVLAADF